MAENHALLEEIRQSRVRQDQAFGAMGARWGLASEQSFRAALKGSWNRVSAWRFSTLGVVRVAEPTTEIVEACGRRTTIFESGKMRLTEQQREVIREAGLRHFGVIPQLFGSRLSDSARGGDIDLFIPGAWSAEEAVTRRLRFCAELRHRLGDQKIDVVVEQRAPSSIQNHAQQQAEPV